MEMRRFRKPTTVIEGLKMNEKDLQELGTKMKKMLATGVRSRTAWCCSRGTTGTGSSRYSSKTDSQSLSIEVIWSGTRVAQRLGFG